jgi:uncharacterized protein with PIN domain
MDVLNNPIDPLAADKLYEVTCRTCSAAIRFSRSEATSEVENKTAFLLTIDCPVCNTVVTKTLNKKVAEQLSVPEKYNHLPF